MESGDKEEEEEEEDTGATWGMGGKGSISSDEDIEAKQKAGGRCVGEGLSMTSEGSSWDDYDGS